MSAGTMKGTTWQNGCGDNSEEQGYMLNVQTAKRKEQALSFSSFNDCFNM
jgi:hypothetical protein